MAAPNCAWPVAVLWITVISCCATLPGRYAHPGRSVRLSRCARRLRQPAAGTATGSGQQRDHTLEMVLCRIAFRVDARPVSDGCQQGLHDRTAPTAPSDSFRIIRFSDAATEFSACPSPLPRRTSRPGCATDTLNGEGGTGRAAASVRHRRQPARGVLRIVTFSHRWLYRQ